MAEPEHKKFESRHQHEIQRVCISKKEQLCKIRMYVKKVWKKQSSGIETSPAYDSSRKTNWTTIEIKVSVLWVNILNKVDTEIE